MDANIKNNHPSLHPAYQNSTAASRQKQSSNEQKVNRTFQKNQKNLNIKNKDSRKIQNKPPSPADKKIDQFVRDTLNKTDSDEKKKYINQKKLSLDDLNLFCKSEKVKTSLGDENFLLLKKKREEQQLKQLINSYSKNFTPRKNDAKNICKLLEKAEVDPACKKSLSQLSSKHFKQLMPETQEKVNSLLWQCRKETYQQWNKGNGDAFTEEIKQLKGKESHILSHLPELKPRVREKCIEQCAKQMRQNDLKQFLNQSIGPENLLRAILLKSTKQVDDLVENGVALLNNSSDKEARENLTIGLKNHALIQRRGKELCKALLEKKDLPGEKLALFFSCLDSSMRTALLRKIPSEALERLNARCKTVESKNRGAQAVKKEVQLILNSRKKPGKTTKDPGKPKSNTLVRRPNLNNNITPRVKKPSQNPRPQIHTSPKNTSNLDDKNKPSFTLNNEILIDGIENEEKLFADFPLPPSIDHPPHADHAKEPEVQVKPLDLPVYSAAFVALPPSDSQVDHDVNFDGLANLNTFAQKTRSPWNKNDVDLGVMANHQEIDELFLSDSEKKILKEYTHLLSLGDVIGEGDDFDTAEKRFTEDLRAMLDDTGANSSENAQDLLQAKELLQKNKILDAYEQSCQQPSRLDKKEATDFASKILQERNKKPCVLKIGWNTHAVSATLYKNFLVIGNRGDSYAQEQSGCHIFKLKNGEPTQTQLAEILHSSSQNQEEATAALQKVINIKKPYHTIVMKGQKLGNCTWLSQATGLLGTCILLEAEKKITAGKQSLQNATDEEKKELSQKAFNEAVEEVYPHYKTIRNWSKGNVARKLLNTNQLETFRYQRNQLIARAVRKQLQFAIGTMDGNDQWQNKQMNNVLKEALSVLKRLPNDEKEHIVGLALIEGDREFLEKAQKMCKNNNTESLQSIINTRLDDAPLSKEIAKLTEAECTKVCTDEIDNKNVLVYSRDVYKSVKALITSFIRKPFFGNEETNRLIESVKTAPFESKQNALWLLLKGNAPALKLLKKNKDYDQFLEACSNCESEREKIKQYIQTLSEKGSNVKNMTLDNSALQEQQPSSIEMENSEKELDDLIAKSKEKLEKNSKEQDELFSLDKSPMSEEFTPEKRAFLDGAENTSNQPKINSYDDPDRPDAKKQTEKAPPITLKANKQPSPLEEVAKNDMSDEELLFPTDGPNWAKNCDQGYRQYDVNNAEESANTLSSSELKAFPMQEVLAPDKSTDQLREDKGWIHQLQNQLRKTHSPQERLTVLERAEKKLLQENDRNSPQKRSLNLLKQCYSLPEQINVETLSDELKKAISEFGMVKGEPKELTSQSCRAKLDHNGKIRVKNGHSEIILDPFHLVSNEFGKSYSNNTTFINAKRAKAMAELKKASAATAAKNAQNPKKNLKVNWQKKIACLELPKEDKQILSSFYTDPPIEYLKERLSEELKIVADAGKKSSIQGFLNKLNANTKTTGLLRAPDGKIILHDLQQKEVFLGEGGYKMVYQSSIMQIPSPFEEMKVKECAYFTAQPQKRGEIFDADVKKNKKLFKTHPELLKRKAHIAPIKHGNPLLSKLFDGDVDAFRADDLNKKAAKQFKNIKMGIEMAKQMVKSVENLHKANCIHNDIKEANFVFRQEGEKIYVALTDFGGYKELKERKNITSPYSAGTPDYMAPEILGDGEKRYSKESDYYALAVALGKHCKNIQNQFPDHKPLLQNAQNSLQEAKKNLEELQGQSRLTKINEALAYLKQIETSIPQS